MAVVVTVNTQLKSSLDICTLGCITSAADTAGCAAFGSHAPLYTTNLTCACGNNPELCQVDVTLQSLECSAAPRLTPPEPGSTPDGCTFTCLVNPDTEDGCISFFSSNISYVCTNPQFRAAVLLQSIECSAAGISPTVTGPSTTPSPVSITSTSITFITSTVGSAAPASIVPTATSSKPKTADSDIVGGVVGGVVGGGVSLGLIVGLINYIIALRRNLRSRPSGLTTPVACHPVVDTPGKD